jgi:uncharacterized protein
MLTMPTYFQRYLIDSSLMTHNPHLTAQQALDPLDKRVRREPNRTLLEKGRSAYGMVKATVLQLGSSKSMH